MSSFAAVLFENSEFWGNNPFAVVVMAHSYTKDTKHKPNERVELKWRLTRKTERGARCAIMGYNIRVSLWIKRTSSMEREQMGVQPIKKATHLLGAIVGGAAGGTVGGILAAVVGDFPLEGSIIGGLLALAAGGVFLKKRLHALRAVLCDEEIRQLSRESITMAVARYIKDDPDVTQIALNWLDGRDASKWLAMSKAKLEAEASQRLEQLARLQKFAQANHPDVWDDYRIEWLHIKLGFGAAKTGIFQTAMGDLAYFLDAVGADYDELRLFWS